MKQLEIKKMRDYIIDVLVEQIMSGSLKDGTKLTQEDIAQQTQLSRMPVREALQALEQEGFLVRLPNRHMKVIGVSKNTIVSTFSTLSAIESEFSLTAIQTNADISTLDHIVNSLEQSSTNGNQIEIQKWELDFHIELSRLTKNPYVINLHEKFLKGYFSYATQKYPRKPQEIILPLKKILKTLKNKEITKIRKNFDDYYQPIIDAMTQGGTYE